VSATDFKHISANSRLNMRVPQRALRAIVTKAPASTTDKATVAASHGADGGTLILGEASWPKPAGKELPARGDECLVVLDETGQPWIGGWAIPNWGH
jgi:hypothetical protein